MHSPLRGNAISAGPLSDFLSDFFLKLGEGGCPRSVASRQTSLL